MIAIYYALVGHNSKERSRRREAAEVALEDDEVVFLLCLVFCVFARSEVGMQFCRRGPTPTVVPTFICTLLEISKGTHLSERMGEARGRP